MYLAIDLGSTSFKAARFDSELRVVGRGSARLEYDYGAGGVVEFGPENAKAALISAIREAMAGCAESELAAIALTSQAQTFTVCDSGGRPRRPFISWQDNRVPAGSIRDVPLEFARHTSFRECLNVLQVAQLRHLLNTGAGGIAATDLVLKLPAYFMLHLTGRPALDNNLAAMSGLYSMALGTWWPEALAWCGLSAGQLPEVTPVGTVAGRTSEGAGVYGLPSGIPVVLAGNDQTAGAYGACLHEQRAGLITLGTAHAIYLCESCAPAPGSAMIQGPYPGGLHYRMEANDCGGNVVNWGRDLLCSAGSDNAFFELAARSGQDCHGLRFIPDVATGQGAWAGIGFQHGRCEFARSILEALADRVLVMVRELGVDTGRTPLLVAGGGSRQQLWIQLLSQRLGCALRLTDADPLQGAALMARDAM